MNQHLNVTYRDHMGTDEDVVDAARVSFSRQASAFTEDQNNRLIKYLATHQHYSPFGHQFVSFHVICPLFVHAQLLKHKFLRANTRSGRYTTENIQFYRPPHWRGKAATNKQGSAGVIPTEVDTEFVNHTALRTYNELLDDGVAPEMARIVLPACTVTEFIWSGSLDAWASMANLRCTDDTQWETRQIANQIDQKMLELFPVSWDALTDNSKE